MRAVAPACAAWVLLAGCAAHPDHFYVLEARTTASTAPRAAFTAQVVLRLSIPSLIDRPQMVVSTGNGVAVLEHQRWAAPLAEQMTRSLGQDIEARRADILVTDRQIQHPPVPLIRVEVEVVQVTAAQGSRVAMQIRWQALNAATGEASLGREVFTAPDNAADYSAIADGVSACIGLLADRLVQELPSLGAAAASPAATPSP